MSLPCRFIRLSAPLMVLISVAAVAPAQHQTGSPSPIVMARIKLDELSMIIVPVRINDSSPYDFLLDTGSSKTMVDQKLADQLGLPRMGEKTVLGMLGSARMSVVHVTSLSVAGATVPGGDIFSSDHPATVASNVRGVLGEDFLQNFDLLIDYRNQSIRFEAPLGSMAATAVGERLPLELNGALRGQPTHNRLVISASIPELGTTPVSLLLDSGANSLTLFRDAQGLGVARKEPMRAGNFNQWTSAILAAYTVPSLRLGGSSISDLTFIAIPRRAEVDTDGILPASLFHSVFISARGKFVVLNPSFTAESHGAEMLKTTR